MRSSITLENGKLCASFPYSQYLVRAVSSLDARRRWCADRKVWELPAEQAVLIKLCDLLGIDPVETAKRMANALFVEKEDRAKVLDFVQMMVGDEAVQRPPVDLSVLDGHSWLTAPYEHQRVGVAELMHNRWWLLAYDMGVGKSFCAANRLKIGIDRGEFTGPVLVLCPKSVMSVWPDQLRTHAGLNCTVIEGYSWQKKLALLQDGPRHSNGVGRIIVTNYETIASMKLKPHFEKVAWDVVILDEVQRIKGMTTQTSRQVRKISKCARFKWGLSGTPAPNGPCDWFGLMTWLHPNILGSEYKTVLESKYCIKEEVKPGVRVVVGYRDLADLRERVSSVTSRVLKEDCLDLPDKVFVDIKVDLDPKHRRVYDELRRHAVATLKSAQKEGVLTLRNVLTERLRLLQCAGGHVPDDDGRLHHFTPNAKLESLLDLIKDMSAQPIVIWTCFREDLSAIAEQLADDGKRVRTMHGDTPQGEREDAVKRFQAGEVDAFVATSQTGGVGLTLTRACVELFFSRNDNAANYWQSVDRLHRIGQTRKVTVFHLMARDTVDEKVDAGIKKKWDLQESMMRDTDVEDLV